MRAFLMILLSFSLSGCFAGTQRSQVTTTFEDDPGDGPVHRQKQSTTASGSYLGGQLPLMGPGGIGLGSRYGGAISGGLVHNDDIVGVYQTTLVRPVVMTSSVPDGGYGGRTSNGGSGQGVAEETDTSEITAVLAKHDQAIAVLAGGVKLNSRQSCQLIVGFAAKMLDDGDKTITWLYPDVDERKEAIGACQDYLAKHPHTKTTKTEAK